MSKTNRDCPAPTYEVAVLGCKVNQYEAQQIRRRLDLDHLRPAEDGEQAGVVVVHTCAVTANAVRKSRQTVRRLREEHPTARIVVTGCAAAEDLLKELGDLEDRIPPREGWLGDFGKIIEGFRPRGRTGQTCPTDPATPDFLAVQHFAGHARAFLKVQDGCDIGCSFCIVPRLRRKPRDKPIDLVVEEARALAEHGHRELVVSGISVGLYGKENGGSRLAEVLRRIIALPNVERIRLSSLHPGEVTDELLAAWASSPKMMPHVHLPLQSGSDRVLAAMRRNYSAGEFLAAVERARAALDDPAFNTDVIVGFPGETDEDFEETRRVSRAAGFSRMHIFPYSIRPHTAAARMPEQVPSATAKARAKQLKETAAELALGYARRYEGKTARVLAEDFDPTSGIYSGYTERYIPVTFPGPPGLRGDVVQVRLTRAGAASSEGEIQRGPVNAR